MPEIYKWIEKGNNCMFDLKKNNSYDRIKKNNHAIIEGTSHEVEILESPFFDATVMDFSVVIKYVKQYSPWNDKPFSVYCFALSKKPVDDDRKLRSGI